MERADPIGRKMEEGERWPSEEASSEGAAKG